MNTFGLDSPSSSKALLDNGLPRLTPGWALRRSVLTAKRKRTINETSPAHSSVAELPMPNKMKVDFSSITGKKLTDCSFMVAVNSSAVTRSIA